MKSYASILLVLFICLVLPCAYASQPQKTLLLATVDNLPPFTFTENNKLVGVSVDIVNEIARRSGFSVKIVAYPWARVLLQLRNGQIDGAFSAYRVSEREDYCLYAGIIHYDELRIAVIKTRIFQFSTIENLYGKVIGKGRNVFVGDTFAQAVKDGKIIVSETNDMDMSNIKMLLSCRVDAVIGSPAALMYYCKQLGVENEIVLLPVPLQKRIPSYLVLSKKSALEGKEDLQRKIQAILDEMWRDGSIRAINKRYEHVAR